MTGDENDLSGLLSDLGFVRGTGFDGEVWTNTDSEVLEQVWIYFSGNPRASNLNYDAREGFDLKTFFKWWEKVTYYEQSKVCSCCGR